MENQREHKRTHRAGAAPFQFANGAPFWSICTNCMIDAAHYYANCITDALCCALWDAWWAQVTTIWHLTKLSTSDQSAVRGRRGGRNFGQGGLLENLTFRLGANLYRAHVETGNLEMWAPIYTFISSFPQNQPHCSVYFPTLTQTINKYHHVYYNA